MGNIISCNALGSDAGLQLSNGGTSVLLSVLLLAASDLAATPWELACTRWLAEHDQDVFGMGMVGFDLGELACTRAGFEAERAFLLRVVDAGLARHRWEALAYEPPFVAESLRELRAVLERLPAELVVAEHDWAFRLPGEVSGRCPRHQVLLHPAGCLLCNDAEEGPCRGTATPQAESVAAPAQAVPCPVAAPVSERSAAVSGSSAPVARASAPVAPEPGPSAPGPGWRLRNTDSGALLVLPRLGALTVGRDPLCELHVPSAFLARRHARLVCAPDGLWIEPLDAPGSLLVNGKKVQGLRALEVGDGLVLGGDTYVVERSPDGGVAGVPS